MGKYEIVSDAKKLQTDRDELKYLFIRRRFQDIRKLLEKEDNDVGEVNSALMYHILGDREKAEKLYLKSKYSGIAALNYMAFCHRFFFYKKWQKIIFFRDNCLEKIYKNNEINYLLATQRLQEVKIDHQHYSIYIEQMLNDMYDKMGREPLHRENDKLKKMYMNTVQVLDRKVVNNIKKRVGIFATDIQRHKNGALVFELVDILKDDFEIYVYLNDAFTNKLARQIEMLCTVRHVINLYFEEVNNLIYDDEIDIIIDMGGYGLRNSNLSMSNIKNKIDINDFLLRFPIRLKTELYFGYIRPVIRKKTYCVIGDARCLSDAELIELKKVCKDNIVFLSHAFNEDIFVENFLEHLRLLGYDMTIVTTMRGIHPFSEYMRVLSSYENIVVSSGTSYVELSEAIKSNSNIIMMSKNKRNVLQHQLYNNNIDLKDIEENCERIKIEIISFIKGIVPHELVKVANKQSRIGYCEGDTRYCIGNTCNSDIVIYDEGKNENINN